MGRTFMRPWYFCLGFSLLEDKVRRIWPFIIVSSTHAARVRILHIYSYMAAY